MPSRHIPLACAQSTYGAAMHDPIYSMQLSKPTVHSPSVNYRFNLTIAAAPKRALLCKLIRHVGLSTRRRMTIQRMYEAPPTRRYFQSGQAGLWRKGVLLPLSRYFVLPRLVSRPDLPVAVWGSGVTSPTSTLWRHHWAGTEGLPPGNAAWLHL
eukprot:37897-Chlamydomonas_euryale.AAC.26